MEKYNAELNWERLSDYEKVDRTQSSQTLACSSGSCEVVDLSEPDDEPDNYN